MKKTILRFSAFVLVSMALVSCSKNDDASTPASANLNALQPVKFDAIAAKTVSSAKTGNTQTNPTTGASEYEYLTTVDKQATLSPLSLVSVSNLDVIYPGSILRGSSFMNSTYDPLVLKNSFNDVVLSGTLQGLKTSFTASVPPTLSAMRNAINTLKSDNKSLVDYTAVPASFEYESTEIYNEQSFKKALDIHVNADVLGGLVSAKFGYSSTGGTSSSSKHTVVKMRQWFYNFAIDPKYYTDWVNGPVSAADCGTHEPVYVSSVDYGRVAFIDIQNDKSEEYNTLMIDVSVKVALKVLTAGADVKYSEEFKALMTSGKVKFLIVGGPSQLAQQISDYDSFVTFVKSPSTADLVSSSVPISYKVRRLKDNTEVEVKDIFRSQYKEYKTN
jgi:thiol-activated cytolysin